MCFQAETKRGLDSPLGKDPCPRIPRAVFTSLAISQLFGMLMAAADVAAVRPPFPAPQLPPPTHTHIQTSQTAAHHFRFCRQREVNTGRQHGVYHGN